MSEEEEVIEALSDEEEEALSDNDVSDEEEGEKEITSYINRDSVAVQEAVKKAEIDAKRMISELKETGMNDATIVYTVLYKTIGDIVDVLVIGSEFTPKVKNILTATFSLVVLYCLDAHKRIWIDGKNYKELRGKQYDPNWIRESKNRLGSSKVSTACGRSRFMTREQYVRVFRGEEDIQYGEQAVQNMADGTANEDIARQIYIREYIANDPTLLCREASMFVPSSDSSMFVPSSDIKLSWEGTNVVPSRSNRIKISPDLVITDLSGKIIGAAEFKCPWSVYLGFQQEDDDQEGQGYIFDEHYDQMHLVMAVLQIQWCDYFVYGHTSKEYKRRRVYFDPEHWNKLNVLIEEFFELVDDTSTSTSTEEDRAASREK